MINLFFLFFLSPSDTTGIASYYHNKFVGRKTASGEKFTQTKLTAACNFYELGTKLKVTNLENDSSIIVTINDRMGHKKRIIDLTKKQSWFLMKLLRPQIVKLLFLLIGDFTLLYRI
ncbi:hypothetical protein EBU94_08265 [bacterium]|nr:hypothetical protein [bacterium]